MELSPIPLALLLVSFSVSRILILSAIQRRLALVLVTARRILSFRLFRIPGINPR